MSTTLAKDHFSLFGLSPKFDIDDSDLYRRYRELQRTLHPDRFVGASASERRLSVQMSAQLNDAYTVLRTPLSRARYLLELYECAPASNPKDLDIEFLQEQILMREEWDGLRQTADLSAMAAFQRALKRRIRGEEEAFSQLTQGFGRDEGDWSVLKVARANFYRMQFFHRQLENCQTATSSRK